MPYTAADLEEQRKRVRTRESEYKEARSLAGEFPQLVKQKLDERKIADIPEYLNQAYGQTQQAMAAEPERIRAATVHPAGTGVNISPTARMAVEARGRAGIGDTFNLIENLKALSQDVRPSVVNPMVGAFQAQADIAKNAGAFELDLLDSMLQEMQERRLAAEAAFGRQEDLDAQTDREILQEVEMMFATEGPSISGMNAAIKAFPHLGEEIMSIYERYANLVSGGGGTTGGGLIKAVEEGRI